MGAAGLSVFATIEPAPMAIAMGLRFAIFGLGSLCLWLGLVSALGERPSRLPFAHGARHLLADRTVFASYHCSRQNTNTGTLTPDMFRAVFAAVRAWLDEKGE